VLTKGALKSTTSIPRKTTPQDNSVTPISRIQSRQSMKAPTRQVPLKMERGTSEEKRNREE